MARYLLLFLCFAGAVPRIAAQSQPDTLFAHASAGRLVLLHPVQKGEKLTAIARRYAIFPETLAAENGISFAPALTAGLELRISLTHQNLTDSFSPEATPVALRCEGRENFVVLAASVGRTFKALQALNPGLKQYCTGGATVLLGYLSQQKARKDEIIPENDVPQPDSLVVVPVDTPAEIPVPKPPVSTAEADFQLLVDQGVPLNQQSGPVVFFPGGNAEVYYAFHNTASHGTIVRFRNPANGRVVYAKVIGKVPGVRHYYKAAAAVSENARRALGSLGDARLWCEIAYAGY